MYTFIQKGETSMKKVAISDLNKWFYAKSRSHHNKTGRTQVKNGSTRKYVQILSRKLLNKEG
jgi:hypothetical protein